MDMECIQKQKLSPFFNFVDKISRKMVYKGCRVAISERNDALHGIHNVGGINSIDVDDIKTILQASLSKTEHCDQVFEQSWNELLAPPQTNLGGERQGGTTIPEGMQPIIEKQIANMLQQAQDIEGMIVDEKEMKELLKQGKVQAEAISQLSKGMAEQLKQQCEQNMQGQSGQGLRQCLIDVNKQIKDMINQNIQSGKLSKLRGTANEVEQLIDQIHKDINGSKMSDQDAIRLKEFLKDLKAFKDILSEKIKEQIPKMDVTPYFDDPEKEQQFIDQFMRGDIFAWGHPEFIGMLTKLDYFKSKIRQSLKQLKTKTGQSHRIRTKGKIIDPRVTMMTGMKQGVVLDLFYKNKPPKQKEDVVWLLDTSGSMQNTYAFVQPIVDELHNLGIRQKMFLGTEEGLEVRPNSNFTDTLEKLGSQGTVLSQAFDDIKPKVGTFKNKTFIVYSDMEDSNPEDVEKKLQQVVQEGGKVLLINNEGAKWDKKYLGGQIGRTPIIGYEKVNTYNRLIEVLKEAAPIIKK